MALKANTPTLRPALTLTECATVFNCSVKTVRRMVIDGRLPAVRVGTGSTASAYRVRYEDVADYLAGRL